MLNGVLNIESTVWHTGVRVRECSLLILCVGDGLTLLHQAAQFDRTDLIDFLCEEGHDTEVKTLHGETALDQAAWRGMRVFYIAQP